MPGFSGDLRFTVDVPGRPPADGTVRAEGTVVTVTTADPDAVTEGGGRALRSLAAGLRSRGVTLRLLDDTAPAAPPAGTLAVRPGPARGRLARVSSYAGRPPVLAGAGLVAVAVAGVVVAVVRGRAPWRA